MDIKVLQWNAWFKQDVDEVVGVLKAHPADVICMQELTRGYIGQKHENTWEYIAHQLGYEYRVQEIPIITPDAQWSQANVIFSKYPIISKKVVWLHEPEDPESLTDQYRGYLEVEIDTPEGIYTVATTHMSYSPAAGPDSDLELEKLIDCIEHKKQRYILTGDLNVSPENYRVTDILTYLSHAGPPLSEFTWPTKPFSHDGIIVDAPDRRLDYIFMSRDLVSTDSGTVQTHISDHLPVFAVFKTEF